MTMRDPRAGRRLAPWLCGALLGIAVAANPGLALRIVCRSEGTIASRVATLIAAPAEAAETLKFRPVPRESESVVSRRVARSRVRMADTVETTDETDVPAPPEAPDKPGLLVTRSGDVM